MSSSAPYPRIVKGERPRPGFARFLFDNGEMRELEWCQYVIPQTVFAALSDSAYADQWKILEYGRGLEWPDGVDWSAGAVYLEGKPVLNSKTQSKGTPESATRR